MVDRAGQQFGNYRLVRLLGQGGFADVYLGKHLYLDRQAAIKILQTRLGQQDLQAFLGEARTIADLVHPHVVHVLDFGVEGNENIPFLVMEYAPHGTIRQRFPQGTRVPLEQVVSYVSQIADALQYAHAKGIVHRDVKPENMLLTQNDEVQLSDFGIAVVAQNSRSHPSQANQDVGGTVAYMAPEQLQGKPGPASDQYALAVVVYELLVGARPFSGSFAEIGSQHLFAPVPSVREKVPALPLSIEGVVQTALAKDPRQRFGNVQAFANALRQAAISPNDPTYVKPYATPTPPPPPYANPMFVQAVPSNVNQTPPPPPPDSLRQMHVATPAANQSAPPVARPSGAYPPVGQTPSLNTPPATSGQSLQTPRLSPSPEQPAASVLAAATPAELADQSTQIPLSGPRSQQASTSPPPSAPAQEPPRRRAPLGYIAIIVLLVLVILVGGSAWAYSAVFGTHNPAITPTAVTHVDTNATATASAATVTAATDNATATAQAVAALPTDTPVPTATPGTMPTSGKVYNASVKDLQLTCISLCSDKITTVVKSIAIDLAHSTMTWQFTVTNNADQACSLHTLMDLEDPTGSKLAPDSGTFTDSVNINASQTLPLAAFFSKAPTPGVTYLMNSSFYCDYHFRATNQVEQFVF